MNARGMLLLVLAIAAPATAFADIDQAATLGNFVVSPVVRSLIESTIQSSEPEPLKAQCAKLKVVEANNYTVVSQPVFMQNGDRIAFKTGAFTVAAKVDRCGQAVTRRVLIVRNEPNLKVNATRLTPGDFPGNIQLEKDTVQQIGAVAAGIAHCAPNAVFYPIDARNVSFRSNDGGQVIWTFSGCGKFVRVDVDYTPWEKDGKRIGMDLTGRNATVLDRLP